MALANTLWKLASPYDAYVSHVARLQQSIDRIRYFEEAARRQQAGLEGTIRIGGNGQDSGARAARFRDQLASAANTMTDEQFEEFLAVVGGGETAPIEHDRARAEARRESTARGLEEYFAIAGQELALLEKRGYSPARPDVARQLRENGLPAATIADYRHQLREIAASGGPA